VRARTLAVITALVAVLPHPPSRGQISPSKSLDFALASPESQGISDESLRSLASGVRGYVERDEITGAELLVIKNRRTVLHETFGWRDREQKIPMERNTIFNVRSMTKPLTGMATQMLIDAGRLRLDDKVSTYLESFANDKCREITVEQLLTHRSGLPLMIPIEASAGQTPTTILKKYKRQAEIVDLIAQRGPETKPGQFFQYSDAGSEALGALVSAVAGQSLEEFIKSRILVPLKMVDAMMPFDPHDPRAKRASCAYLGIPGSWLLYWRADSSSIYPFAMGSQSLYCTPSDYARFLALWMDEGTVGGQRILSVESVRRALTPISDLEDYGTGFSGLKVRYGQMWMLFVPQDKAGAGKPVLFGHGGSDGTMVWAWPELDLMILYFTQNRGTSTVFSLEREIERLIIRPSSASPAGVQAENLKFYVGTYALKPQPSELFMTTVEDGKLILETPQGTKIELLPPDADGIWRFWLAPNQGVTFSAELPDSASSMWIVDPLQLRRSNETPLQESAGGSSTLKEYLGTYVLPASVGQNLLKYWIVEESGGLVFKSEQGSRFDLRLPDDQDRWYLTGRPMEYLTFQRNATGDVIGCTLYQMHECVRTTASGSPGLSFDQARKYLGTYYDAAANIKIEVIFENGRLAVRNPALPSPVALRPTGKPSVFSVPINPNVSVRFNEDANGEIVSHTVVTRNGEYERLKERPATTTP
jgi:CubicO group peptidase (beta-lactamase class C family)